MRSGDFRPAPASAKFLSSRYYLAVAHEVSDTTSLYQVTLDKAQRPKR